MNRLDISVRKDGTSRVASFSHGPDGISSVIADGDLDHLKLSVQGGGFFAKKLSVKINKDQAQVLADFLSEWLSGHPGETERRMG